MTAAARQVSTTLKSRATELRGLFDGLWKASLKFIPPFQLEEMGMQRASEGIVRKIGEIEWVAEEVGRVRMGMEGGSGSGSGSGNEGVVVDGGERRAGPEFKDGN
ncbi:hypothetical protein EMCG_09302 [[Emmonsia] crescens]|uniref:Uncharacterized protein n=1 Tax=[Emmonsia] crescens TaxID=73230 RepID=A0A0G2I338_9EURO|nr:hypothetical protein EMCG_09302 [Emmonsia crescens UAMH 3008]